MEKIILFDWGGVVESPDYEYDTIRDCLYFCGFYNVDSDSVYSEYHKYDSAGFIDAYTNEEELDEELLMFLKNYRNDANMDDVKKYKEVYKKHMANNPYYKEISEYISSLKGKCKLGLFSNVSLLDKDRQMKHMDYSSFDYRFLSCELGMRKPNGDVYEYVNEKLKNFKILFIDDRSINLETPKELGWDTYCANSGGDLNGIKNAVNKFLKGSE